MGAGAAGAAGNTAGPPKTLGGADEGLPAGLGVAKSKTPRPKGNLEPSVPRGSARGHPAASSSSAASAVAAQPKQRLQSESSAGAASGSHPSTPDRPLQAAGMQQLTSRGTREADAGAASDIAVVRSAWSPADLRPAGGEEYPRSPGSARASSARGGRGAAAEAAVAFREGNPQRGSPCSDAARLSWDRGSDRGGHGAPALPRTPVSSSSTSPRKTRSKTEPGDVYRSSGAERHDPLEVRVSPAQARGPEALEVRVAPASARGSNRTMTSPAAAGGQHFEAPGAEHRPAREHRPSSGVRPASHQAREHRLPGGGFKPGERVVLSGLESAKGLNGEEGVLVSCDPDGGRWVVRLSAGDEFRARPVNLISLESPSSPSRRASGQPPEQKVHSSASDASETASQSRNKSYVVQNKPSYQRATTVTVSNDPLRASPPATRQRKETTVPSAQDGGTELEGLLLQTNWSAIYQLFHQRFGIATMDKLERGFVVKGAVEMTLSIVAKCFALLRSDPSGRLHCTPLHIAALQSSTEAAEVIVRDLPKLVEQTHKPSRTALTPLHIAVLCGGQAIAELLLEAHADPNVRTLHDVCPIHLASTTSKEMVQLLLAFGAESTKKDVMGSTAMHYATCFRQHRVTEALLAFNTSAERLATESDQKRVSPLHIACALYASEDDMLSPLHLLANGAKPYQTDVSGASAREVARGGHGSALQQFFERVGDRPREAALQILEDNYLKQSADAVGEGGQQPPVSGPPSVRSVRPADEKGAAGGALRFPQRSGGEEIKRQLDQLQLELEQQQQKFCLERDQLQMDLEHSRQKIAQLEQADANQKKMTSDWQALLDSAQKSHQVQLEEVRKRHGEDRALWEENTKAEVESSKSEALQRAARQHESVRRELEARLQEADSRLHAAEEERKADVQQLQDALGVAEQDLREKDVDFQKSKSQLEERNHNLRQRDLDIQLLKAQLEERNHNLRQKDLDLQLSKGQVKELRQKDLELQQAKAQLEDLRQKDLELQQAKSQLEDLRQKDMDHQKAMLQLEELRQKDMDHQQAKAQLEAQAAQLEAAVRDLEGSRQQLEQQAAGEQQQAKAQLEDLRRKDLDLQQLRAQLEDLRRKDLEHQQAKAQLEDLRQKDLGHQQAKAELEASLRELEEQQHQRLMNTETTDLGIKGSFALLQQPVEQQLVQSAPVEQQLVMQQPMQMQQVQQQEPAAVVAAPVLQMRLEDQGLRDAILLLYSQWGLRQPADAEAPSGLLEPIAERLAQMQGAPEPMARTLTGGSEVVDGALASRVAELEAEVEGHMKRNSELNEVIRTEKEKAAQLAKESRTKAGEDKELEKVEGRLAKEKEARRGAEQRARELERAAEERAATEQALQEQLRRLQDEIPSLRTAKEQAEDKARELEMKVQEAQTSNSSNIKQLESDLQRVKLESTQEIAKLKAKAESAAKLVETLEEKVKQAQPMIDEITQKWLDEQDKRKKLHNQLQDMKGAIRVYCRFRPMVKRELDKGDTAVLVKKDSMHVEINRPAPLNDQKQFQFEAVYDGDSTQESVFSDCRDLIQSAVDGYNVTVFAYGQTGAGKTHTMYGNPDQPGLAPRTIAALFELVRKQEKGGGKKFVVKAYMIEVYKQDIIDLLGDPSKQKKGSLEVKKDVGRGIMYVDGVTEHEVKSPAELEALLSEGEKKRHVATTKMNSASSRSHLLLSIIIEGKVQETQAVIYGKVTLCDLAGSERPKKSEVTGDGLKEAIEINKSLSALGDVVEALCKGSKSVPYRNHKLTMLMQDSLGGSAKTLMFVNCSPASSNAEETMMSLTWANRARKVTNDVKRNVDTKEVARLKQVIKMMSMAQTVEEGGKATIEDAQDANDLSATMAATAAGGWVADDE